MWKTGVLKLVAGWLQKCVTSLRISCREPENFADTFKCQTKCFILAEKLKKEKDVNFAETEMEKQGRECRERQQKCSLGQNETSCKLQHLFLYQ